MSTMSMKEFFAAVQEGELTDLEIHNYVQAVTDNFKNKKLKLLLKDLKFFLFEVREERYAEAVKNELPRVIEEYKKAGKELPYREYELKTLKSVEHVKILNVEALCYPWDFYFLQKLKNSLVATLEKQDAQNRLIKPVPIFQPEALPAIAEILMPYFSDQQRPLLLALLERGAIQEIPLVFLESGNKLAYAFKVLYEAAIITGCTKKELEQWIQENFIYLRQGQKSTFPTKYLNTIISTTQAPCKNPILEVEGKKVFPTTRSRKKY